MKPAKNKGIVPIDGTQTPKEKNEHVHGKRPLKTPNTARKKK